MLDGVGQFTRLRHVRELSVDVRGATDQLQHAPALLIVPALDEAIRRLREEEPAHRHQQRRCCHEAERESPPPRLDFLRAVVDHVRREDAKRRRELKHHVQPAAEVRRRHLRQVQRHSLIAETDADAKHDAAEDQRREVRSRGV
uniref:Uncharacterized protein n=1 Tax=Triticum urartu TaxID=4572 RepID=A0A8R7QCU0_TRIUA